MNVFKAELDRWKKGKYTVVILGQDEERVKKLHRVLADYEIEQQNCLMLTASFLVKFRFYAGI